MLLGAAIKLVMNFKDIAGTIPQLNIKGAAFGTGVVSFRYSTSRYFVGVVYRNSSDNANIGYCLQIVQGDAEFYEAQQAPVFVKPLIAAVFGTAAWAANGLLGRFLPTKLTTLTAIVIGENHLRYFFAFGAWNLKR